MLGRPNHSGHPKVTAPAGVRIVCVNRRLHFRHNAPALRRHRCADGTPARLDCPLGRCRTEWRYMPYPARDRPDGEKSLADGSARRTVVAGAGWHAVVGTVPPLQGSTSPPTSSDWAKKKSPERPVELASGPATRPASACASAALFTLPVRWFNQPAWDICTVQHPGAWLNKV